MSITLCITSCDRFDLLEKTLDSFFLINKHPIIDIFLTEDSEKESVKNLIIKKYPKIQVFFNNPKIGQVKSIDLMYSHVKTKYIMHIEDDWYFDENPNFLSQCIDVLESDVHVNQVWIRHRYDFEHPYEHEIRTAHNGANYLYVQKNFLNVWCGFSFNPTLLRLSDYKKFFPNGYAEFGSEYDCNIHAASLGWTAATLTSTACKHLGWNRHTTNFKA